MRFRGQKWKKSKIKICNLEWNEKFLLWKCAYFLRKLKGKWVFKHFFIFFKYPLRGHFYKVKNHPFHFFSPNSDFSCIMAPKKHTAKIIWKYFSLMICSITEVIPVIEIFIFFTTIPPPTVSSICLPINTFI